LYKFTKPIKIKAWGHPSHHIDFGIRGKKMEKSYKLVGRRKYGRRFRDRLGD